MTRIVNRVVLALLGLFLSGAALGVLLGGFGLPRPGFSPFDGPDDVLLSESGRTRYEDGGWWWPLVIGLLSVLTLLAIVWLIVQLRQRRLAEVLIDSGEESSTQPLALLRARALEEALAHEAGTLEGVERAHVTLTGRRTAPQARVGLLLGAHAHPAAAVEQLRTDTLRKAITSTGLERLPAEVRLRAVKHRPERVT